ncbi:MAG: rhamnulokinase [Planctomycetota bacterium]
MGKIRQAQDHTGLESQSPLEWPPAVVERHPAYRGKNLLGWMEGKKAMHSSLAIDIGAGSGRVVRGTWNEGRLHLEELHRFENKTVFQDGHERWDVERLFVEVCEGLKRAARHPPFPDSIGVDTWGVDFALLNKGGQRLELPVTYRDARTEGMMGVFFRRVPKEEIFRKTGIQFLGFNTLYQLFALALSNPSLLGKAETLLLIPDYLNYRLTGVRTSEFTNATTTQLFNFTARQWDTDLIAALGADPGLFPDPVEPGTEIGMLRSDLQRLTGLPPIPVIAPATHDTASAVAAVPAEGRDWAFISAGTWCLMGMEKEEPVTSEAAMAYNFSNEGGICGTWRLLKNLAGLWLVRGLKESLGTKLSFAEIEEAASQAAPFRSIVYGDDTRFFHPPSMKEAFDSFCRETGQPCPDTAGAYVRSALEGLAFLYREVLEELAEIQEQPIRRIHMIGGGSRNRLMCQFCADATGLPVFAGPAEATAAGNALVQAMALGRIPNLATARKIIADSMENEEYYPTRQSEWSAAWKRFLAVRESRHAT